MNDFEEKITRRTIERVNPEKNPSKTGERFFTGLSELRNFAVAKTKTNQEEKILIVLL